MKSSLFMMSWCGSLNAQVPQQLLKVLVGAANFSIPSPFAFLPLKVFKMAARNADSMKPSQGQFHPRRPRDEPATTSDVSSFRIRLRENGRWSASAERYGQYKASLCTSSYQSSLYQFLFNTMTNLSLTPFTAQTRCQSLAKGPS